MDPIKIVYQKKSPSPKTTTRRRTIRTHSPNGIKDQSSKLFRIQVNTPTFYKPSQYSTIPNPISLSPVQAEKPKNYAKRARISYLPSSSLYKKLNVRLTLNTLNFVSGAQKESRSETRSRNRKIIDFTSEKRNHIEYGPLEARGLSIHSLSLY